jgi:hypothetical protein
MKRGHSMNNNQLILYLDHIIQILLSSSTIYKSSCLLLKTLALFCLQMQCSRLKIANNTQSKSVKLTFGSQIQKKVGLRIKFTLRSKSKIL